jgi:hypothetical protein
MTWFCPHSNAPKRCRNVPLEDAESSLQFLVTQKKGLEIRTTRMHLHSKPTYQVLNRSSFVLFFKTTGDISADWLFMVGVSYSLENHQRPTLHLWMFHPIKAVASGV